LVKVRGVLFKVSFGRRCGCQGAEIDHLFKIVKPDRLDNFISKLPWIVIGLISLQYCCSYSSGGSQSVRKLPLFGKTTYTGLFRPKHIDHHRSFIVNKLGIVVTESGKCYINYQNPHNLHVLIIIGQAGYTDHLPPILIDHLTHLTINK